MGLKYILGTTTIPEFRHLPNWWNNRARGLGGTLHIPISTGGEENLLCLPTDRYRGDDIFFHEASHSVAVRHCTYKYYSNFINFLKLYKKTRRFLFQEISIRGGAIPGFYPRLVQQWNKAKRLGKWRRTYSLSTVREYFAEGTQSFFNCHVEAIPTNGIHNSINTRSELLSYDPGLYYLLKEVYPCMNTYQRCTGTCIFV